MRDDPLVGLILVFVPFSLISIGGGASIISGMEESGRHSAGLAEFARVSGIVCHFAGSPRSGRHARNARRLEGGRLGGRRRRFARLVRTVVTALLRGFSLVERPSRKALAPRGARGLAPVGTGLIIAGVISIFQLAGGAVSSVLIAFAAAGTLLFLPRVPTLVIIALGGVISLTIVTLW